MEFVNEADAETRVQRWRSPDLLDLSFLGLKVLPPLPTQLTALQCCDNAFRVLGPVPANLTYLACDGNRRWHCGAPEPTPSRSLLQLAPLPKSLRILVCRGHSQLRELPPLPAGLQELYCDAHVRLPETPPPRLLRLFTGHTIRGSHWPTSVSTRHRADRAQCAAVLPALALLYV